MNGDTVTARRTAVAGHDGLPGRRRLAAILAVSLGTVLTTVSGSIVNIALPMLARELHVASSMAVLVVTVYQLVLVMTLLPFSALGDRIGHRTVYQYGQMLFVAATLLSFFARSLPFLLVVRAFQAAGAAAAMSVSSALIRSIYPASRLGRGLSLNTAIAAGFATLAPTVGGAILLVGRWPWLFASLMPFGILSIFVGRKALPESIIRDTPYDVLGAVMCAAMFGFAIVGLETAIHGSSPVISGALVICGLMIGIVFVRRQLEEAHPVLPVDLLRRWDIALPSIGLLAAFLASMIVMLTLPFRMQQAFHFTPAEAGAVLAPWPLVSLFVAPTAGALSDRISAGLLGGIGMAIAIVGMVSLAFLPAAPDQWDMIWRIAVCGLGFGMFYSPNSRQIVASASIERSAAAGALATSIRGVGQTLGATAVAALLAIGVGTGAVPTLIAAGLGMVAGVCSLAAWKPPARLSVPLEITEL